MTQTPELTVVMPTLNRPDVLQKNLRVLAGQDLAPERFEVIVIQDGCTEAYREAFEAVRRELPYDVQFLQNAEGHCGPGFTQNRGIRLARAPIVLILADDILLEPYGLRAHLETHQKNPDQSVAALGRVLQSPELHGTVFLQHWDPFGFADREDATELPYYMFWACNISVKKRFLEECGMFREHRGRAADGKGGGGAAHEDVELGYRLKDHGLRILYCKEAFGHHYHEYALQQAVQRYYERGVNWGEFWEFAPDPELLVDARVLTRRTFPEYRKVLSGPNTLRGRERFLSWHLLRHFTRRAMFNRVTDKLFWNTVMNAAEHNKFLAKFMSRRLYAAYLHYHFMRGIREAEKLTDQALPSAPGASA